MDRFYNDLKKLIPLKYECGDFKEVLSQALEHYTTLLEIYNERLSPNIEDVISCVRKCNVEIKKCINSYFRGMYSVAYQCIEKILSDTLYNDEYYTVTPQSSFYRARIFETNGRKPYTEMFHIPLDKRGMVKTQRYSAPGYPCLYLGASINACWEELGQPRFDDIMVSRFVVKESFPVFDLRLPNKEELKGDKIDTILKKIPLIIGASVYVLDQEACYKPEYIIPQLIIEYIITKNRIRYENENFSLFDSVLGVYYTSVHINNVFGFPNKTFDNLALPAVNVDAKEPYCHLLASCFEWTDPTSYSYEDIRGHFSSPSGNIENDSSLTEEDKNYRSSKMGKLEQQLLTFELKKLPYLLVDRSCIGLFYDKATTVTIRSSDSWVAE